jgi:3-deoxy-D-manno-octulosonic-acid transferase
MSLLLNGLYGLAAVIASPWLIYKAIITGKYRRGLWTKFLGETPILPPERRVWFHAVSVGEVHLLRQLVAEFRRRHPDYDCVISTTTDTGLAEAQKHFPDLTVFWWPLDFSWAVRRALARIKPSLVVLAEGELWPNFLAAANRQGVPVVVVNGRMSPRSFRRYRLLGGLARSLLKRIDLFVMQTDDYADNLRGLGVEADRIHVSGSIKYDGVTMDRDNPRTRQLRQLFDVGHDDLIWVVGSTQAPEEQIALDIWQRLRTEYPTLRMFVVPRQKDRFEDVAALLKKRGINFSRRSALDDPRSPIILVDTIGELGALWGLADVTFVGGSLDGQRGGQNMLEPAAYGSAVIFGPHVWNFRADAARLVEVGGALQISDAASLEATVRRLLTNDEERQCLGRAAQALILQQQGATARTLDLLAKQLLDSQTRQWAA